MDNVTVIRTIVGLLFFGVCLSVPVIAGILIAKDANARGMNGVGWGIGVVAVFIVFLPLYLIVRKPLRNQSILLTELFLPEEIAAAHERLRERELQGDHGQATKVH